MSQGILWAVFQTPVTIPRRHPNGEPHHITLQYGVEREQFSHLIGHQFEAIITAETWSDRIQALWAYIPSGYPRCNRFPHITVSWVDGVEPVESNALLEQWKQHNHRFISPHLVVPCRVEFYEWAIAQKAQ
ncbi:hypothetical protein [Leptolyngbya sp. FACHB-16]|uniref:hypothetical protein n=1 Tax=unclassified Leptolyngbya TaxID=2650499 RepID=UPI001682AF8F|nr:hypothetical protein [Leptolyngbya sp. FACHB-16]MBD2156286.1 hypothetical protein [Leptolyngbya sp. FACHB-16]